MKKKHLPYHQKPGFNIPRNYFEEFEDQLLDMADIAESAETNDLASLRSPGYKVPKDYFENLEFDFLEKKEKQPKVISLFKKEVFYYVAGVAAILIAVFSTVQLESEPANSWDSVEVSVLEDYIDEAYDDGDIELSTSEISSAVFEDGFIIDDSDFNELDSDAALEYIDENVEDPVYILE